MIHEHAAVAGRVEELPLALFKIGFVDAVAGLEGFLQHLAGQEVAILGLDQGGSTPRRRGLGVV